MIAFTALLGEVVREPFGDWREHWRPRLEKDPQVGAEAGEEEGGGKAAGGGGGEVRGGWREAGGEGGGGLVGGGGVSVGSQGREVAGVIVGGAAGACTTLITPNPNTHLPTHASPPTPPPPTPPTPPPPPLTPPLELVDIVGNASCSARWSTVYHFLN